MGGLQTLPPKKPEISCEMTLSLDEISRINVNPDSS